jgi:hypothetical protein
MAVHVVASAWHVTETGLRIDIRLTPRARVDAIDGIDDRSLALPALRCRVRALPRDGQANEALIMLLAGWLDVPRSAISLVKGPASRVKVVMVTGDSAALAARIERLFA